LKLKILSLFTILWILLVILSLNVRAQENFNMANFFEVTRGELLSISSTQVTAHAGIILALIVGLASIGKDGVKAISHFKRTYRILAICAFSAIISLIWYEIGRLLYWSGIGGALIGLDLSQINDSGIYFTDTNATACMNVLDDRSISLFMHSEPYLNKLGQWLHPDHMRCWLSIMVCIVVILVIINEIRL
jgi:hypothetical protein